MKTTNIPRAIKLSVLLSVTAGWQSGAGGANAVYIEDKLGNLSNQIPADQQFTQGESTVASTGEASLFEQIVQNGGSAAMKITKEPLDQATADRDSQKPLQGTSLAQIDDELAEVAINNDHVLMPLTNNQNYGYIGKFWVGSGEPQEIKILLDTGSANSWISGFDKDLTTDATFNEPESHGETKITFGSGYLKGYFVTD